MESKIDYRVLTMDEIVFDNRNKAYGAFVARQKYEKNLVRAILFSIGFFSIGVSSPAILKSLGMIAESPLKIIEETILKVEDFTECTLFDKNRLIQKPPPSPTKSDMIMPVKKDKLLADTKTVITQTTTTNSTGNTTANTTGMVNGAIGSDSLSPGNKPSVVKTPLTYKPTEQLPEFIGGENAFEEFVEENLEYPDDEKLDGVEGIAKVQFIVTENGTIELVRIAKSSGNKNLDAAAVRLVKSLPRYLPGKQNGQVVRVLCVLPIEFEIR